MGCVYVRFRSGVGIGAYWVPGGDLVNLYINVFGIEFARITLDIPHEEVVQVDRIAAKGVHWLTRWWTERMF